MGTQRVQIKGVLPWLVCWACTRDFFSALAALVGTVQNTFFFIVHNFNSLVPIAQQAGLAGVLGGLFLRTCLCLEQYLAVATRETA
jgi:hypothetical protein